MGGLCLNRALYELTPLDEFQNFSHDTMGRPIAGDGTLRLTQLTEAGKRHILGIQGQLWGENLRSPDRLEYMAFPRVIALAERAGLKIPPGRTLKTHSDAVNSLPRPGTNLPIAWDSTSCRDWTILPAESPIGFLRPGQWFATACCKPMWPIPA